MSFIDISAVTKRRGKFGGAALAPSGKVVFAPAFESCVGILDLSSNGFSCTAYEQLAAFRPQRFRGAVTAADGAVVFAPFNATQVAVFNAASGDLALVSLPSDLISYSRFSGLAVDGCRVLFAPYAASSIGILSTPCGPHAETNQCLSPPPPVTRGLGDPPPPLPLPPPPPSPSPPGCEGCGEQAVGATIYAIVHGYPDSVFWNTWAEGARNALPPCTADLLYAPMSYNVSQTEASISAACDVADGIIVTIPYAEAADLAKLAGALNKCHARRPDIGIKLSNTDTTIEMAGLDFDWNGYAGSFNYAMGEICARLVLTNDLDLALGQQPTGPRPTETYEIYFSENELGNSGIVQRSNGLLRTLGSNRLCEQEDSPTTTGGTATPGSACAFPFVYKGVEYSKCTTVDNGNTGWCSVEQTYVSE